MDKPTYRTYRADWERKCLTPAEDGPGRVVLVEHVEDLLNPWIQVKDRAPEHEQDILYVVSGTDAPAYVKHGMRCWDGNEWWWCDEDGEFGPDGNDYPASTVTLWMPLPKPPAVRS